MRQATFAVLGMILCLLPALAVPPKSDKNQKLTNDQHG